MKLPLLVCLMVVAVSCDEKVKDAFPPGPPGIFTNSTTAAPTTLAPTTNQPTTTPNTTVPTTTKQPTTTTTKPSTTTPTKPPTTTSTKPPTTTPTKPPTTTLPPPTTPAPPPTPVPEPSEGKWALNYPGTNLSCILLDVAVQFEIIDGNSTMKYNVPNDSLASGECGKKNDSQGMTLTWTDPATKNSQILSFGFALNQSKYDLDAIHLSLNFSKTGNDSKTYFLHHDKQEFSTPLHNSYKCAKVQTLNMTDDKNNTKGYLHISHVQLEAFANATGRTFSSAKDCAGSITPDVVPIVVGCVLAALVVMVLVAYLIGRRRCQARGYLSMFNESQTEEDIPLKNLSCFK